jgi:hypothetical protein
MTINDECMQIRGEIAKLRADQRRRYPPVLKGRILAWTRRATAAGILESECGPRLGIKTWRIRTWQQEGARPVEQESVALVPIEVHPLEPRVGPTLVTPSGYRVEGLALEQLATLLRELA